MKLSLIDLYITFCFNYLNQLKLFTLNDIDYVRTRYGVLKQALEFLDKKQNGLICEFGVYTGTSINFISENLKNRCIYGFNSFEGFPKDGRSDWCEDFSCEIPSVNKNCCLVKGYFNESLKEFLKSHPEKIIFIHMDCDIYSSANDIFNLLSINKAYKYGTIIVFDELINYKTSLWNEILALFRFLHREKCSIRWLSCHKYVENIDQILYQLNRNTYIDHKIKNGELYRQQASCYIIDKLIDYSNLESPVFLKKIKYMTTIFKKFTNYLNMNSVTNDDFKDIYI